MARVESWTRNGDRLPDVETDDPDEILRLENAPFDDASNISSVFVDEGR